MSTTLNEPKSAPRVMLSVLNDKLKQGWKIFALLELTYPGELQVPMHADMGLVDPSKINVVHLQMPHGDHHHDYIYILVDPTVDFGNNELTEKVLTALKLMEMDEEANVEAVGNA